ncbi:MAG: hypothetical protein ACOX79_04630 [Methanosarcina sp.]
MPAIVYACSRMSEDHTVEIQNSQPARTSIFRQAQRLNVLLR